MFSLSSDIVLSYEVELMNVTVTVIPSALNIWQTVFTILETTCKIWVDVGLNAVAVVVSGFFYFYNWCNGDNVHVKYW